MVKNPLGCQGALTLPLAALLVLVMVSAAGIFGFLQQWRLKTTVQLRLDRCVGEAALELRDHLNSLEASNRRMKALRASIGVAILTAPQTVPPLQQALQAQFLAQEVVLKRWEWKRLNATLGTSCTNRGDRLTALPELPWSRSPADALGEQPLHWPEGILKRLEIRALHPWRIGLPERAAAAVTSEVHSENSKWISHWTALP